MGNLNHHFSLLSQRCRGIVAAWGIGGEPFHFPEEAGYPVGEEHGGSTYYMFEVSGGKRKFEKPECTY